jgi:peptidoglycan/LPS O-acetylase OafA/YrhL
MADSVALSGDKRKHLPALDGLRGLAVAAVFFFHYGGGAKSSHLALRVVARVCELGWGGVTLFFVLSGFLITRILRRSVHEPRGLREFYKRRALRILPLYYAALVLAFATSFFVPGHAEHRWNYLAPALFLQDFPRTQFMVQQLPALVVLLHFWTLSVEEHFYLLWPLVVRRVRALAAVCVAVFVLSIAFRWGAAVWAAGWLWQTLPSRAGELALGAWLAVRSEEPTGWTRLRRVAPVIALLCVLVIAAIGAHGGTSAPTVFNGVLTLTVMTLLSGALVALGADVAGAPRVLSVAPLRFLGRISYGVYVFHILFVSQFDGAARALAGNMTSAAFFVWRTGIAAAVSVLLAWLSFRFFESPLRRTQSA